MSIQKASNKQQGESASKDEAPKSGSKGKVYTFPKYNITINASSPEEARKKLEEQLRADKGDN